LVGQICGDAGERETVDMLICALPHAEWNPRRVARAGRKTLAETFGEGVDVGDAFEVPARWNDSRHIFVCRRYDLLAEPETFIQSVFHIMATVPQHDYQISTSRGARLLEMDRRLPWRDNIWMGVRVGCDADLEMIDDLRGTGARVKFVEFTNPETLMHTPDLRRIQFAMSERDVPAATRAIGEAGGQSGCKVFVGPAATASERRLAPAAPGATSQDLVVSLRRRG
jgi:protein gp37